MLFGLMLNSLVTDANAGVMPVVGMPASLQPDGPMWQTATSRTQLRLLADQARLGWFSAGDLMLIVGGFLILGTYVRRALKTSRVRKRVPIGE
jgi:hypothetical protein